MKGMRLLPYRVSMSHQLILMAGSYLEQLLKDSQELHDRQHHLKQENRSNRPEQSTDSQQTEGDAATEHEPLAQSNLLGDKPWFQSNNASVTPLYISEATCGAFATRLCQCLKGTNTPTLHLPRSCYTDESAISSLICTDVQWPGLVSAQLMVKTALGHIIPCFHLSLKKDTLDMLHSVYRKGDFENPSTKCKYFALFAIAQVYSTPHDLSNTSGVPGLPYFAKALSLIQVVPERPSMIHIESLLLIVGFPFANHLSRLLFSLLSCSLSAGLLLSVFEPLSLRLPFDRERPATRPRHRSEL